MDYELEVTWIEGILVTAKTNLTCTGKAYSIFNIFIPGLNHINEYEIISPSSLTSKVSSPEWLPAQITPLLAAANLTII